MIYADVQSDFKAARKILHSLAFLRHLMISFRICIWTNFAFFRLHFAIHPSPCLYAHLPPRLILVIRAHVSGLGEQRAGERRWQPSIGTLTRDAGAGCRLSVDRSGAINQHMGTGQRRVCRRTGTSWERKGKHKHRREGDEVGNKGQREKREKMMGKDKIKRKGGSC